MMGSRTLRTETVSKVFAVVPKNPFATGIQKIEVFATRADATRAERFYGRDYTVHEVDVRTTEVE